LNLGNYHGIEPNAWLIDDAVEKEVGSDQIRIKRPRFLHHDTFDCGAFGVSFDYIVAQSIFSHCGADLIARGLEQFAANLSPQGVAAVTFIHPDEGQDREPGQGWVYPEVVTHSVESVAELISDAALQGVSIPWYHPRQTWWILARDSSRLPGPEQFDLLRGAVLSDPATIERR
jgi:cyclopropane fatty-acyl-phospholipid synthase-like methyltransferase